MKKFSAVDWQAFALKKDIESITKRIKETNSIQLSTFAEIALVVLGAALANIFAESVNQRVFWIIVSVLSAIPVTIAIGRFIFLKIVALRPGNDMIGPKEFIDSFDNSICYYVLMAESYYSMLMEVKDDSRVSIEVKQFYFIEASYYMNKAIAEIAPLSKIAGKVLTTNRNKVVERRLISIARYYNLHNLIEIIYQYLKNNESILNDLQDGNIVIATNYDYYQQLKVIDDSIAIQFQKNSSTKQQCH